MVRLMWHVWHHGHSVTVNRHISIPQRDIGKGWLYRCECGLVVAR